MPDQKLFKVYPNVKTGGNVTDVIIETYHQDHIAYTAIHKKMFARSLGGVRIVNNGSKAEAAHLAQGMADKCALNSVPVNGMKCLIVCKGAIPAASRERALIIDHHLNLVKAIEPGVIFGPDMGTNEDVMDILADGLGHLDNVTGLSKNHGGLEIDRNGYTAIGAYEAFEFTVKKAKEISTVSIQGFGSVGTYFLKLLDLERFVVSAISNIEGTLIMNSNRFDKAKLLKLYNERGDACLRRFAEENESSMFSDNPDAIFDVPADVFIPAARTSVIANDDELKEVKKENPDAIAVQEFHKKVNPKAIIEIANHPLSYAAEQFLEDRNVVVLPDYVVNCGGMIGCYTEWRDRSILRADKTKYDEVNLACIETIRSTMHQNMKELFSGKGSKRKIADQIVLRNLNKK